MPYPIDQNDETLANKFGTFFKNKIKNIISKISNIVKTENIDSIVDYTLLEPQISPLYKFDILTQDDVKTLIMFCKSKSCILDPLPVLLLKELVDILVNPMTKIVNKSPNTGIFQLNTKLD